MNHTDWHSLSENTRNTAIKWHVRLTSRDATDAEYDAFALWMAADDEHPAAFSLIEKLAGRIESLGRMDRAGLDYLIEREEKLAPWSSIKRVFSHPYAIDQKSGRRLFFTKSKD